MILVVGLVRQRRVEQNPTAVRALDQDLLLVEEASCNNDNLADVVQSLALHQEKLISGTNVIRRDGLICGIDYGVVVFPRLIACQANGTDQQAYGQGL
ncbi:hypothetical protein D3C85_1518370 [compost metagenome]